MIEKNGVKVKQFYGMSSAIAMEKHAGGVAEYRLYKHIEEGNDATKGYANLKNVIKP